MDNTVKVILTAQDSLSGTLNKISSNFGKFAGGIIAALGVGSIGAAFKSTIDDTRNLGEEVLKFQRITGMSAEAASELIAVSDQVKVSFDALQSAVVNIERKMGGLKGIEDMVVDSSGKTVDIFEKFGIVIKNTDGQLKPFADVFEQIRQKIQSASSETERMAIATQFFRTNAASLMPLLTLSSAQWKEIAEDAKRFGLILTQDNVASVKEYVMAHRDLGAAVLGTKLIIGQTFIPILTQLVKSLTENIFKMKEFIKEHRAFLSLPWNILKDIKDNFTFFAAAIEVIAIVAFRTQIAAAITALVTFISGLISGTLAMTTFITAAGAFTTAGWLLIAMLSALAANTIAKWWTNYDAQMEQHVKTMQKLTENYARAQISLTEFYNSLGIHGVTIDEQIAKFHEMQKAGTMVFDEIAKKWINIQQVQEEAAKKEKELITSAIAMRKEELTTLKSNMDYKIALEQQYTDESIKLKERELEALQKEPTKDVDKIKATEEEIKRIRMASASDQLKIQQYYAEESIKLKDRELIELQKEPDKNKDKIKATEEAIKQIKIASAGEQLKIQKDLTQGINAQIDTSKNKIKEFEKAIVDSKKKIRDITSELDKDISDIENKGKKVDPFQLWQQGMQELDKASSQRIIYKDLEAAEQYAQSAREIFKSLGETDGGQEDAAKGLMLTKDELLSIEEKRKQTAEEGVQTETANMQTLIQQAQTLQTAFSNMQLNVDSTELDAVIARYQGLDGSSVTVKVIEETQEAHRFGGLVGVMRHLASGGWLPGWGGGDKIQAALEAGEYVMRKEAVSKYGVRFFEALNNFKVPMPGIGSLMTPAIQSAVASTPNYSFTYKDERLARNSRMQNLMHSLVEEMETWRRRR